ncbi:MAG TPA: hypothetical protein VM390_03495 [Acidimicrobiales bacterium]|nr:hypothetical protein [Acidimicrobiales bacterium]
MRVRVRALAAAAALVVVAGCGGSESGSGGASSDIVATVASYDLAVGPPSRLIVGVQSVDRRFVAFGTVQFRVAYLGTTQDGQGGELGPPVPARFLALPGVDPPNPPPAEPVFVSGAEARGVYAALVGFPRAGFYQIEVTAKVDGRERTATAALAVNERHAVPAVGDRALPTENFTVATPESEAPRAAIDSRAAVSGQLPDTRLHGTTVAAALAAGRPAVLVISTPVYCQSQFCGPVTDMVDELAARYEDRASFVHIELWRDFQGRVINRHAAEWLDDNFTEPWVFVIGADGVIKARFDNVATEEELEPLLQQLPVIGRA